MTERVGVGASELGRGWWRSAPIQLLDFEFALHSDEPALVEAFEALYAPAVGRGRATHALTIGRAETRDEPGYFAALDGGVIVRTTAPTVAFAHLLFEANQRAIEESGRLIRLHAAAALIGGRAVVLPGPMGAGKSTLVAALAQRGAAYVTDEVVAFDPGTTLVVPYPKPVSLGARPRLVREVAWRPTATAAGYLGDRGLVPARALGACVEADPVPAGIVVLPRYESGRGTTVTALGPADALTAVGAHTFGLDRPGTLAILAELLAGRSVYQMVSGDLVDAARTVEELAARGGGSP